MVRDAILRALFAWWDEMGIEMMKDLGKAINEFKIIKAEFKHGWYMWWSKPCCKHCGHNSERWPEWCWYQTPGQLRGRRVCTPNHKCKKFVYKGEVNIAKVKIK